MAPSQKTAISSGHDGLGRFFVHLEQDHVVCGFCGSVGMTITYSNNKKDGLVYELYRRGILGHPIEWPNRLILKHPRSTLGIECGCYGRFHRQIAYMIKEYTPTQRRAMMKEDD